MSKSKLHLSRYTGNYYFRKRLFGGFDIMIEAVSYYVDQDGTGSPNFIHYRKATESDLAKIEIEFPYN